MDKTFDDDEFLWSQFIRLGEMLGLGKNINEYQKN